MQTGSHRASGFEGTPIKIAVLDRWGPGQGGGQLRIVWDLTCDSFQHSPLPRVGSGCFDCGAWAVVQRHHSWQWLDFTCSHQIPPWGWSRFQVGLACRGRTGGPRTCPTEDMICSKMPGRRVRSKVKYVWPLGLSWAASLIICNTESDTRCLIVFLKLLPLASLYWWRLNAVNEVS